MELRQLRHFVGVVECGNVSRAAVELHITQPALTRSIHILEEQVGAPLLHRSSRGVTPTEAGLLLLRHAKPILNSLKTAEGDLQAFLCGVSGRLHVGVGALFANCILDEAIASLVAAHPDVTVKVTVGPFEEMADMLRDGYMHLAFSVAPQEAVEGIAFEALIDIHSHAVAASDHPLVQSREVSLEDLHKARWALIDQRHMGAFMDGYFAPGGLPAPTNVVLTNSLELLRSLVRRGEFVTMLGASWIAEDLRRGELATIRAPGLPVQRKAGLLYREGSPSPMVAELFMQQIRAICADAVGPEAHYEPPALSRSATAQ